MERVRNCFALQFHFNTDPSTKTISLGSEKKNGLVDLKEEEN